MAKIEKDEKFYGVEVNGVMYFFETYDIDAIKGLLLFKTVVENEKKGDKQCS